MGSPARGVVQSVALCCRHKVPACSAREFTHNVYQLFSQQPTLFSQQPTGGTSGMNEDSSENLRSHLVARCAQRRMEVLEGMHSLPVIQTWQHQALWFPPVHRNRGAWVHVRGGPYGPLPKSKKGNVYLLVVVDYFTKWVELFPIRDSKTH